MCCVRNGQGEKKIRHIKMVRPLDEVREGLEHDMLDPSSEDEGDEEDDPAEPLEQLAAASTATLLTTLAL